MEDINKPNIYAREYDKYENLCDILEYGGISNEEAITICNNIIAGSISENENSVLEAMFHAVFTGVVSRQIGKEYV